MAKKEKVVRQEPGAYLVEVTYKNNTGVVQGFYDAGQNLITVQPGEKKSWYELRVKKPTIVMAGKEVKKVEEEKPFKEATSGSGSGSTKESDKKGGGGSVGQGNK